MVEEGNRQVMAPAGWTRQQRHWARQRCCTHHRDEAPAHLLAEFQILDARIGDSYRAAVCTVLIFREQEMARATEVETALGAILRVWKLRKGPADVRGFVLVESRHVRCEGEKSRNRNHGHARDHALGGRRSVSRTWFTRGLPVGTALPAVRGCERFQLVD